MAQTGSRDALIEEIDRQIEEKLLDVDALERTREILLSQGVQVTVDVIPRIPKRKRASSGNNSPWASKIEMLLGTSPRGMTTTELLKLLDDKNIPYQNKQSVYGAIHLLKKAKRIRTDKAKRHHPLVAFPSTKLLQAAGE